MSISDSNIYQRARDCCDLTTLSLDCEIHKLCGTDRTKQSEKEKDKAFHRLHTLEEQWKMYRAAIDLIDRPEEVSVRDTIHVLRFFKALHRKNEMLLAFYREHEHGSLAEVLNTEEEIRTLKEEQRCNALIIQHCEEHIENPKAK